MKNHFGSGIVAACVAMAISVALSTAHADDLNVYGSPAYSPTTGGYRNPAINSNGITVNGAGVAVGVADEYSSSGTSVGYEVFSWSASGVTILNNLGTGSNGEAQLGVDAINDAGMAVGSANTYNLPDNHINIVAVEWSPSGAATELENIGGTDNFGGGVAVALAINDAGTVAGSYALHNGTFLDLGDRAVRWDNSGNPTELGTIGTDPTGYTSCSPVGINSNGTVVGTGWAYNSSGSQIGIRAIRWDPSGTAATQLGDLGTDATGSTISAARAINDAGTIIGTAEKYDLSFDDLGRRAVRWDPSDTTATELGNLGTTTGGVTTTAALAINSSGTIVGYAEKYDASGDDLGQCAVRWDASGTAATELGNLGTQSDEDGPSQANAINSSGIAVGFAEVYDPTGMTLPVQHAVYWGADDVAVDLNNLIDPNSGWVLNDAYDISDTGWIDGVGTFTPADGQASYQRLFLMNILPEPVCIGMLFLITAIPMRRKKSAGKQ